MTICELARNEPTRGARRPLPPMKLILASQSPRRRQLLQEHGYHFEVSPPADTAECGICSRETPPELVARLAYQKAGDVARRVGGSDPQLLVIGCDTVAECAGRILGKPVDRAHAREMLRLLRGRPHKVYSGLCLWRPADCKTIVQVDVTELVMDDISDAELKAYLDTQQWEGKAGAFGYQDGLDWVHIRQGSESNVVGLPTELLAKMLQEMADNAG